MRRPARWRRRAIRTAIAILGLDRHGFYLAYPYRRAAVRPGLYEAFAERFAARETAFGARLRALERYADAFADIGRAPPPEPRWDQDWFPCLDAAFAYAMVREARPRRILEIGAGHSTRFFARALADAGHAGRIVAIDPLPRASLDGLECVTILRRPLESVALGDIGPLEPGDVLSLDSSHVLMPGSDVDIVLNRFLPSLPAGVLVHIHDIFLPDDYPVEWHRRGYNEQLAVAALLTGGGWRIEWASHYVRTRMTAAVRASVAGGLPLLSGARESSLWLTRLPGSP